jgi:hypothetical protein
MDVAKGKRKGFDDLIARRAEFTDVSPSWSDAAGGPGSSAPAASMGLDSVPAPSTPAGTGPLSDVERARLETYEAGIGNLRVAFWLAGKCLQGVRDEGLYRETHRTFESYVEDIHEISRAQAYRLISAWPLAEALSPIGDKITESQVRELLPLAEGHGVGAAVTVYQTIAEVDGVRVTAAVLRDIVNVLPADRFDPAEAAGQIRAYLAGDLALDAPPPPSPTELFAHEVQRLRSALRRTLRPDTVRSVASQHPEQVHEFARELRALADELDQLDPGEG